MEAPIGLGLLDRELRFVRVNSVLADINGLSKEAHIGRTAWDLFPDLRESAEPPLKMVLAKGEPLRNVVVRGTTPAKPGAQREWLEHFYPIHDGGVVTGIGIVCEEVTERATSERARRASEARLAESDRRFKLALSNSPITVFEHDAALRYQWLFNSKLGYSDTFAIGKTDREIMDPGAAAPLIAFKQEVLDRGMSARREVVAAAPGQLPEYFDLHVHPRRDEAGHVDGLICVATEITEKKKAEEALKAANDTFRRLVERSPFGIYVVDADFRLVQISEGARKVFANVRPLIGRDFAEVLHVIWPDPFATEAIQHFRRTLATGEPYHSSATVERRADIDATEAYDWKIERIRLPDGRPGVVCHFYDLSERQRHEEREKLLLREVSHRLKNLLSLVQSIARQTARRSPEDFLDRFEERILSLSAAHDLLVQHDWRDVPLGDLIRSQLSHLDDLIGGRISVSGPNLSVTPAASQALGMALHELATNAVKYGALSNATGRIEISWRLHKNSAGARVFEISWKEHGGPPVIMPDRKGFGTTVTTEMVKANLDGEVSMLYPVHGLSWHLTCPAETVIRSAAAVMGSGGTPD